MNKKDSKRIDYVAPQVIDLGISPVLSGQTVDCDNQGQSNPGSCHLNGNRASKVCENFGSTAGGNCKNGQTAGVQCSNEGSFPLSG